MPKFSIITPTYNRAYVLWKLIISVQNQTFTEWELLIIDDGSTDDTKKLLAEFQFDARIKYQKQTNQGPSAARNTGLSLASGEVIVYLDSDDEPYSHFLSTIFMSLNQHPDKNYGVCNHNRSIEVLEENFKTKTVKIDPVAQNPKVTLEDFYNWEVKTTSSGMFHRKDFFLKKLSWKSGIYIEDLEFLMQMAVLNEEGFLHIPASLFHYTQKHGGDGLCSQATYKTYADTFGMIYEWHKNDPLMKKPEVYLDRKEKYSSLHEKYLQGEVPSYTSKYFH